LGARAAQVDSFAWAEAAFVTGAGLLAAAGAVWGPAELLVRVLTGLFDPAPAHLAVPWGYLGVAAVLTAQAATLAAGATVRSPRTTVAQSLRDL